MAIDQYKKTLQMDAFDRASSTLGWAYALKEMYPEAIAAWQAGLRSRKEAEAASAIGETFRTSGFRGALKSSLDYLLKKPGPRASFGVSALCAQLGQANEALAALEKAYAGRAGGMAYIKSSPLYDPIRSDPRFQDLIRRVGFPQ